MAVRERAAENRGSAELRWTADSTRAGMSFGWVMRQIGTIALAHCAVLIVVFFLLLLGDALFTSYAIALQDAVFVSYVAQLGWLQRMASDVKGSIAFVVAVSALFQMLLLVGRVVWHAVD